MDKINKMPGKFLLFLLLLISIVACEKVTFAPIEVSDDISFKDDIQPIHNNKCISCHPPTQGLDLTDAFAYNELVPKYAAVSDSANPGESKLYLKLTGNSHQPRTSDVEKQKFLNWISQGVPNN